MRTDCLFPKTTMLVVAALLSLGFGLLAAPPPVKRGPLIGGTVRSTTPAKPAVSKPVARPVAKPVAKSVARPARPAAKSGPPPMTGKAAPKGAGPLAPYRSAIAVDAANGRVLFADFENRTAYPASVTKLMTFLLILEDIQAGRIRTTDKAVASAYAASMEPSKVDIRPGQSMTIDDLLLSIMVKSANDAAVVLAEHSAWIRSGGQGPIPTSVKDHALVDAFVMRMNRRAQELGMSSTRYFSPNGLPPGVREARGFDTSTAADQARLCRTIVKIPGALRYTSKSGCRVTGGDGQPVPLSAHNYFLPGTHDKDHLVVPVEGCDGLKTGYTAASGSSIALTAARGRRRVVVVVLGSAGRHEREAAAGRILRDALDAVSW